MKSHHVAGLFAIGLALGAQVLVIVAVNRIEGDMVEVRQDIDALRSDMDKVAAGMDAVEKSACGSVGCTR